MKARASANLSELSMMFVPKVLLLLTGIVTLVSFLRSFVSPERVL